MFKPVLVASLLTLGWTIAAQTHEVSVDIPFTPQLEVAGIDTPPFELEDLFTGPVGEQLYRARCSPDLLIETSVGEWLEKDERWQQRFISCVALVMRGPLVLNNTLEAGSEFQETPSSVTSTFRILAELYRAPYNLSAAEAVSGTFVVLGMATPQNRRSLMRAIAE
ncbi:hypothetical protein [Cognatiyoonia sp. IB215182]|uniref:hypothetical protein n=1 Tax=Cognatiyoonia sp. IB215182 TaxID=3097353 RepID=UPI002A0E84C6|nr:hypothetical protein [Cognatiyoonia sp. IB215182]MDX8355637.1 hypothetical protein [Cognatiyoonia sp. IB215182]